MIVDVWFASIELAFGFIILFSFSVAAVVWYWLHKVRWV